MNFNNFKQENCMWCNGFHPSGKNCCHCDTDWITCNLGPFTAIDSDCDCTSNGSCENGCLGPPGPDGNKGLTGDKGPDGNKGSTGDKGPDGNKGSTGDKGLDGNKGSTGDKGLDGNKGSTGDKGPDGNPGGSLGFAYIYDTTLQSVASKASVTFNKNNIINPSDFIMHSEGPPGTANITIKQSGTYLITYEVNAQQGNSSFALYNGSNQIAGSNYGSSSGGQTYSGQIITTLSGNDVITLKNIQQNSTTLDNVISPSIPVLSASIIIVRLS